MACYSLAILEVVEVRYLNLVVVAVPAVGSAAPGFEVIEFLVVNLTGSCCCSLLLPIHLGNLSVVVVLVVDTQHHFYKRVQSTSCHRK